MYTYPFKLEELPYRYDSLEPYIDKETIFLHHDKHLKNYVDRLNEILSKYPKYQNLTLEEILKNLNCMPLNIRDNIKNNGGGVYNHNLYFKNLIKKSYDYNFPDGKLLEKINEQYINFDNLYKIIKTKALDVFGSGYTWLVLDSINNLNIINTKNQDTVLELNLHPIMIIDLWEHSYYLKYKNRRNEYIDNLKNIINWNEVKKRYLECVK